jgi:murein DD-endopeptidase MepM/ murein hydrolase activator NlpD
MSKRVFSGRWIGASRIALVTLIGGVASACSSDTTRFSEPFANPFSSSQRVAASETRATAPTQVAAVPTPVVHAQALPPMQAASASRVASAPVTSSQGGWSAAGGTRITVGPSDNLDSLSQRYGVPSSAILTANGLSSSSQVASGKEIVIPVFDAGSRSTHVASTAQPKFRLVETPKPSTQKVAEKAEGAKQRVRPGMASTALKERSGAQQVASARPISRGAAEKATPARPAPRVVVASAEPQSLKAVAPAPAPVPAAQPSRAAAPTQAPAPQPQVAAAPASAPAAEPEQTGALGTDFRWPARGRVIAGFGANGGNEGINIALPEGTPVKATEAGTVTYAGSEVKGYGNLVLIRHDNGYVSAYAHNGALSVKRGERVKRGQVIATSGQTGNVTSPQLHFELRKGQAPVDPTTYLSGT